MRLTRVRPLYFRKFTATLEIPADAKAVLVALTPASYVGNAAAQARAVTEHVKALRN